MSKISQMQIEEILDNGADEIRISKHPEDEGVYVIAAYAIVQTGEHGRRSELFDKDAGPDIGELVNELHSRL